MLNLSKIRRFGTGLFAGPILFAVETASAQLCTGNLGDPIVTIDFGSGTGHGAALGSAVTAYTYDPGGDMGEGYYTITNSTGGVKGNAWHVSGDHTGNDNGYMMLINCATLASEGIFYTKEVSGLCPNTTYEFSAWIMNVMTFESPDPNVTFRVLNPAGTVLGSYNTGDLPVTSSPEWLQYGFFFNTGSAGTVIIKILNSAPSAMPGNDLAIDDISFRPCGPHVEASANGSTQITVCAGALNTLNLHGEVSAGYATPGYQWQVNPGTGWVDIPGATGINFTYSLSADANQTNARFRLAVAESDNIGSVNCRVLSNEITLQLEAQPVAAYTVTTPACVGQQTRFTDQSTAGSALGYLWNFGDGSTSGASNPTHVYSQTGTYPTGLVVVSANGCTDTTDSPLAVTVYDVPQAAFTAFPLDTTIFVPEVTVTDLSENVTECTLNWGDGSTGPCSQNTHSYAKYGKYDITQTVTNEAGCTDSLTITIIKEPEYRLFLPNAFTPDGNNNNELFKPAGLGWEEYSFRIYNRWGQKIFETHNTDVGWDGRMNGKEEQTGLYVYHISFRDAVDQKWHEFRGSVTLLK